MIKQKFIDWVVSKGYTKDSYGHYQKTSDAGTVTRFKIQASSVRYERKAHIVDHNEWLRSASGYYKDLSITHEGKLSGMKRRV